MLCIEIARFCSWTSIIFFFTFQQGFYYLQKSPICLPSNPFSVNKFKKSQVGFKGTFSSWSGLWNALSRFQASPYGTFHCRTVALQEAQLEELHPLVFPILPLLPWDSGSFPNCLDKAELKPSQTYPFGALSQKGGVASTWTAHGSQ